MEVYEGVLAELGPSEPTNRGGRRYLSIKIGNHVIKNVQVNPMLDAILRGEVNAHGDQKIYVARYQFKNAIIGIETAEKKVYKLKFSWFWWLILAACGVVLTPVLVGFLILFFAITAFPLGRSLKEIKADYEV
jgi:hypothetical protein